MKVFVTGGTGCVGQYVTKALLQRGDEVTLLTRNPERAAEWRRYPNAKLLKGSLADLDALTEGTKGADAVIHMALNPDISIYGMLQKDTLPMAWLLEQSAKNGVKKFIATSTVAVTMRSDKPIVCEADYPMPKIAYAGCKAAVEMLTMCYDYIPGLGPVTMKRNVLRPTNCYAIPVFEGGASTVDGHFCTLIESALKNEDLIVKTNEGEQFISAPQLAQAFLAVLDSDENAQVFFASGSRFVTWVEIAKRILELIPNSASKIVTVNEPLLRNQCIYNTDKLRERLGLSFDGLEDLDEYLNWQINDIRKNHAKA